MKQKAKAVAKISEVKISNRFVFRNPCLWGLIGFFITTFKLRIETRLHEDTVHHSSAVSNLSRTKITGLSKQPNTEDLEDSSIVISEEEKEESPNPIAFPATLSSEQKKSSKPVAFPATMSSYTDSEDSEDNSFKLPLPLKRSLDIYEMNLNFEMDWAPWKFDLIINNINLEYILCDLYKKCQKTRPKIKTSLEYGLIDLNDSVILNAISQLVDHFETEIQKYNPAKALSEEVVQILKTFNVVSIEK